jgi:hypothetical protein
LLFDSLAGDYKLLLDRKSTLSSQAAQLMTFAGIIQTVLVGLLVALATNPNARTLLSTNPNYQYIVWIIGGGFGTYLLTAFLAIFAYRETWWVPAPVPIRWYEGNATVWGEQLENYHKDPNALDEVGLEMQLVTALNLQQTVNDKKYNRLQAGYVCLVVGITLTAIAGLLMLLWI